MNLKQFTLPYGLLADRRADRLGYAANVKERIPNVFNVYRTLETALEEGYFVIPNSVLPQVTGASVVSALNTLPNATITPGITFSTRFVVASAAGTSIFNSPVTFLSTVVFGDTTTFNWTTNVTGPSSVLNVGNLLSSTGDSVITDLAITHSNSAYATGSRGELVVDTTPTSQYSGDLAFRPIYQFAAVPKFWSIPGNSTYNTGRPVYKAQPVVRPLTYLSRIVGTSEVAMIDEINSQSGTSPITVTVNYVGTSTGNVGEFTMVVQHDSSNGITFTLNDENHIIDMAPSMHITSIVTSSVTPVAPENFQSETTITFYTLDPVSGLGTATIPHGWIKLEIYPTL